MAFEWELPEAAQGTKSKAQADLAVSRRTFSDVKLVHESDGGNLVYSAGLIELDDGLFNAAYLCLFGGNTDDSGNTGTDSKQWWGNVIADDDAQKLRSEYQYTLSTIACTPSGLRKADAAGNRDLAALVTSGVCTEASISTRLVGLNRIAATVNLVVDGTNREYTFNQLWGRR